MEMRAKASSIGYGAAVTLVLLLTFGFIVSLVLRFTSISEQVMFWPMIASSVAAFIIGGFITGMKTKEKGLLSGMLTAAVVCSVILAFQYLGLEASSSLQQGLIFILFLLAAGGGGALGVNTVSVS